MREYEPVPLDDVGFVRVRYQFVGELEPLLHPVEDVMKSTWPDAHIPIEEPVRITQDNARDRISDAMHTVLNCWSEWESYAQDEAQRQQDSEAYDDAMQANLSAVLAGMIFDETV